MLHALSLLAVAAETEDEPSKTAFYLLGGLLTLWAILVAAIGMSRATFPPSRTAERGVALLSAVLVVGAMATAVITA